MNGYSPPLGTSVECVMSPGYDVPTFDHKNPVTYNATAQYSQFDFNGIGFFSGTLTEQNRPVNGAIVKCIHTQSNIVAKEVTTSVDGVFIIYDIHHGYEYHIVAIDPNGVWENKVSSRRIPRTTL